MEANARYAQPIINHDSEKSGFGRGLPAVVLIPSGADLIRLQLPFRPTFLVYGRSLLASMHAFSLPAEALACSLKMHALQHTAVATNF